MGYKAKKPEQYRVIFHQDAVDPVWSADVPKITPDALLDYSIRQFAHLPIDAYASDANHASGVDYRSKAAPVKFTTPGHYRHRQHRSGTPGTAHPAKRK